MRAIMMALLGAALSSGVVCILVDKTGGGETCTDPAPLIGEPVAGAPGYIVVGLSAEQLAERYGFALTEVDSSSGRFKADLSHDQVEAPRCDPGVDAVAYNWIVDPVGLCADPVQIAGIPDPYAIGQFGVRFNDGVDGPAETERLTAKYGFVPSAIFENFPAFGGTLSPDVVAALRCERSVRSIEWDSVVYTNSD